ncbi:hypothetical protein [Saccharopolyspora taberi]|uniref:Uncharacterized protein n=1 Tax=Saccharopolyspora taberi TaxID=60895 RepID=A0ABN3VKU5_9PSEU
MNDVATHLLFSIVSGKDPGKFEGEAKEEIDRIRRAFRERLDEISIRKHQAALASDVATALAYGALRDRKFQKNLRSLIERLPDRIEIDSIGEGLAGLGSGGEVGRLDRDLKLAQSTLEPLLLAWRLTEALYNPGVVEPEYPEDSQIPELSLYTVADEPEEGVLDALADLLDEFKLNVYGYSIVEHGSWFRRWTLKVENSGAADRIARVADQIERAGALHYINSPRSEVDEREANAAVKLIEAMKDGPNTVVKLSSMLAVKNDQGIAVRVLTEEELRLLRDRPELLKSPNEILDNLGSARENNAEENVECGNLTSLGDRKQLF